MQAIKYSEFKKKTKVIINKVIKSNNPFVITRKNKNAVLLSLDEYNSMYETLHLLKSSKNQKRLDQAIKEMKENKSN